MTTEPKVADLLTKWVNECSQAAPETRWDAGYDAAQRMCACELVAALSRKDAPKATPLHGPHGSIAFDADGQPAGKVKKNCPPPSWMFQNDEGNVDAQPEQQGAVDVAHALEILRVVTSRAMQGSETREAFEVVKAALARQEADNASSPNVIYRWRALDYSGFCYGSNPPHDLPSEACLTAFYRDPEGLRSALHEISATGNLTATDKQFSRHLQQIARDALAGASPPSAPAGQEPVAWYLPSEDGYDSCFRDHRTITSCTGNPWAGWIPLYAAPPAQAVDLEPFREAVRYSSRALPHKDLAEKMTELLALIDQQAGGAK